MPVVLATLLREQAALRQDVTECIGDASAGGNSLSEHFRIDGLAGVADRFARIGMDFDDETICPGGNRSCAHGRYE